MIVKGRLLGEGSHKVGEEVKGEGDGGEYYRSTLCVYENRVVKPTKSC